MTVIRETTSRCFKVRQLLKYYYFVIIINNKNKNIIRSSNSSNHDAWIFKDQVCACQIWPDKYANS